MGYSLVVQRKQIQQFQKAEHFLVRIAQHPHSIQKLCRVGCERFGEHLKLHFFLKHEHTDFEGCS